MSKILFISNNLGLGGAQKMIVWLANVMVPHYDEVYLISCRSSEKEIATDSNVKVVSLNHGKKHNIFSKLLGRVQIINSLSKAVEKISPDIICTFGFDCTFDLVIKAKYKKYPIVASERLDPSTFGKVKYFLSKYAYGKCKKVVFQLEEVKNMYSNMKERGLVIPNPYRITSKYEHIDSKNRDKIIFSAAARLEYRKGYDVLIKAFSKVHTLHPEYKLWLFGKGGYEVELRKIIAEEKLTECVEIKDPITDFAYEMRRAKMFVLTSRAEGIPNTLIESMGMGIPCVATNCTPGGAKMLMADMPEYLVPVDDVEAISQKMLELIENDEKCNYNSERAVKIRDRLSEERITSLWIQTFNAAKKLIEVGNNAGKTIRS